MKMLSGTLRIWLAPVLLALASGLGLIAALLSSETSDLVWALLAGAPLIVLAYVLWSGVSRQRPQR